MKVVEVLDKKMAQDILLDKLCSLKRATRSKSINKLYSLFDYLKVNEIDYHILYPLFLDTMRTFEKRGLIDIDHIDETKTETHRATDDSLYGKEKFEVSTSKFGTIFFRIPRLTWIEKEIQQLSVQSNIPKKAKQAKHIITKQGSDFYYAQELINFGENTIYRDLFGILYSNSLQDSFVSYQKINTDLVENGWDKIPDSKINKRIQNSIRNGIFRYAKLNGKKFQNKAREGKDLIEIVRGKGVRFNNSFV